MNNGQELHRLQIRKRTVLAGDGGGKAELSVFCPVREQSVETAECTRCARRRSVHQDGSGGIVVCAADVAPAKPTCDVAEAAARTPLGAIMQTSVVAVREDASIETLAALLLERGVGCVPVVGHDGGVVGVVTRTDLLRSGAAHPTAPVESPKASIAQDVMTCGAYCLPEDARLSHAFALMAAEGVAHVPVVCADGALVGVVSAEDANRWVAAQLGYVLTQR